jgi:hypothetical protein
MTDPFHILSISSVKIIYPTQHHIMYAVEKASLYKVKNKGFHYLIYDRSVG